MESFPSIRLKASQWRAGMALALLLPTAAAAGPPYVTDDPVPAPSGEIEAYLFSEGVADDGGFGAAESGFEINYGVASDIQIALEIPFDHDAARIAGFELGLKYRFLERGGSQASVYPSFEYGADGTMALRLPIWMHHEAGAWTVFGGGGPHVRFGAGGRTSWLGGLAVSRAMGEELALGAEIYGETAAAAGESNVAGFRVDATRALSERFSILASAGPEFEGGRTRLAYYVALGWHG